MFEIMEPIELWLFDVADWLEPWLKRKTWMNLPTICYVLFCGWLWYLTGFSLIGLALSSFVFSYLTILYHFLG